MRLLLLLSALVSCGASSYTTTLYATATVASWASIESGPGYVEFASNDPTTLFLIDEQPLVAGTYAIDEEITRMADGWRPPEHEYLARSDKWQQ